MTMTVTRRLKTSCKIVQLRNEKVDDAILRNDRAFLGDDESSVAIVAGSFMRHVPAGVVDVASAIRAPSRCGGWSSLFGVTSSLAARWVTFERCPGTGKSRR